MPLIGPLNSITSVSITVSRLPDPTLNRSISELYRVVNGELLIY